MQSINMERILLDYMSDLNEEFQKNRTSPNVFTSIVSQEELFELLKSMFATTPDDMIKVQLSGYEILLTRLIE